MIRRLQEADNEVCQQLISQKPAENLFIIGDIENFGYEQDFQKLWGDFTKEGQLKAVLLKYSSNYIAYAEEEFNAEGFAAIMNKDPEFKELSGLQSITSKILPHIEKAAPKTRSLYYAKCESINKLAPSSALEKVKLAAAEDVPAIAYLQSQISEFEADPNREAGLLRGIENGSARTYFIHNDQEILSSASTTAENSMSAMVVGVCTHPEHSRKGYASLCMTKLCEDLLNEGKMLCLFYDNPNAGSIYKRIGFNDIGKWMMHVFQAQPEHAVKSS